MIVYNENMEGDLENWGSADRTMVGQVSESRPAMIGCWCCHFIQVWAYVALLNFKIKHFEHKNETKALAFQSLTHWERFLILEYQTLDA